MSKRNYNVYFNTHTVSGIIISFLLYVIFFAGAFALFKDEITVWEEGERINRTERQSTDFDFLLKELDQTYQLDGRDIQFRFGLAEDHVSAFLSASKDTINNAEGDESHYFITNIHNAEVETYSENYSLGEFLYRLHFFHQLPTFGIYIAGFVGLLFLFAIVTGIIVHWKKMISGFFAFDPKSTLKRIWTDAHTALGVIGLPFQIVFAVTGAYFCLSLFVLAPANILYKNDRNKLMQDLRPAPIEEPWIASTDQKIPSFNDFVKNVPKWEDFHITNLKIQNFGGVNMKFVMSGEYADDKQLLGAGRIIYDPFTGETIESKDPLNANYVEKMQHVLYRLHFADFGGLTMRIIYFILALVTCFVIISGVLIWIEARNRRNMTHRQRLYTAGVGRTYLAICLSMLPVTALAFIFVKLAHGHFEVKQSVIYSFYFITWLILFTIFRLKKDNYFTNKASLLLAAVFGFCVPLVNGIISGNWIWQTLPAGQTEIALVDLLWILISVISLIVFFQIKPSIKAKSTYAKHPLDKG